VVVVLAADPHQRQLEAYGDLAIKVALNLQPGQRLIILGPLTTGVSFEAAPLVRQIAASAYRAGASLVETLWGDEAMLLKRFAYAPHASLSEFSAWMPKALTDHVEAGHAVLSIYANDPDLLKNEPPEVVGALQGATSRAMQPFRELISRNQTNWAVIAAAGSGWAAKVFPDRRPEEQVASLWDDINRLCRLDRPDPVAAWQTHIDELAARADYLNRQHYAALRYTGPGTDLTVGLPSRHIWVSGHTTSRSGIQFTANLPTEEVFTIPHKDRVDGTVRSTKPLSYGGTLVEDFSLRFSEGRVVEVKAARGEAVLKQLVETDPGAGRLGEIALVPHSSPISQSGRLFYNTLFDENAATHVALGAAYKFTLAGSESMDEEAFGHAGGNRSIIHVDFMIGCGDLDIEGVLESGATEPLMRRGEWSTAV
jgi:aminopeptidase